MKFNIYTLAFDFVFFVVIDLKSNLLDCLFAKTLTFLTPENFFRINGTFNLIVGLSLIFNIIYSNFFGSSNFSFFKSNFYFPGLFNDIAIRYFGLLILSIGVFLENLKKR